MIQKEKKEEVGEHCSLVDGLCALLPVGETQNKNTNVHFWKLRVYPKNKYFFPIIKLSFVFLSTPFFCVIWCSFTFYHQKSVKAKEHWMVAIFAQCGSNKLAQGTACGTGS